MVSDNRSTRTGSFRIARTDYLKARKAIRQCGKYTLGIFHSRPISEAIPGKDSVRVNWTIVLMVWLAALLLCYGVGGFSAGTSGPSERGGPIR